MNPVQEILQSLSERFATTANVKQVFGEPVHSNGRTVVPVARVQYRLGGGWGGGEREDEGSGSPRSGGGGGGMVSACPAGALEITDHDVHFIHFANPVDIAKLFVIGGVGLLVLASLAGRK